PALTRRCRSVAHGANTFNDHLWRPACVSGATSIPHGSLDQRKGFRPQTLLTLLTDPEEFSADEIAIVCHERWELELGTTRSAKKRSAAESRLKSTGTVGIFLAYNLVRFELERAAGEAGIAPTRISFVVGLGAVTVL